MWTKITMEFVITGNHLKQIRPSKAKIMLMPIKTVSVITGRTTIPETVVETDMDTEKVNATAMDVSIAMDGEIKRINNYKKGANTNLNLLNKPFKKKEKQ